MESESQIHDYLLESASSHYSEDQPVNTSQAVRLSLIGEEENYDSTSLKNLAMKKFLERQTYIFNLLESEFEKVEKTCQNEQTRLQVTLKETQLFEKQLSQQKKLLDQQVVQQREHNENLVNTKHDLQIKLEDLSRKSDLCFDELESISQTKALQTRSLRLNLEKEAQGVEQELSSLET